MLVLALGAVIVTQVQPVLAVFASFVETVGQY